MSDAEAGATLIRRDSNPTAILNRRAIRLDCLKLAAVTPGYGNDPDFVLRLAEEYAEYVMSGSLPARLDRT